jgi:hypothetical protein
MVKYQELYRGRWGKSTHSSKSAQHPFYVAGSIEQETNVTVSFAQPAIPLQSLPIKAMQILLNFTGKNKFLH